MRFVVYGIGAIGGTIAGRLFEHGHDVVGIARGAHYEAVRADGLRLIDADRTAVLDLPVVDHPEQLSLTADDVVVLAMKTQDTAAALDRLAPVAPPDGAIVCAQNGVENERLARRRFARVFAMCVMLPSAHLEPGVVEVASVPISGLLDVGGYPHGVDPAARQIATALGSSTFESIPRDDIMRWKYAKLLMNLANSVTAMCPPSDDAAELARQARREGAHVLKAAGIDVASREEDRERRGNLLTPRLQRGGGSSWQSLERGLGSIEADYLNGEIVLLGALHGVPTPVNALLQRAANEAARRHTQPGSVPASELLARLAP